MNIICVPKEYFDIQLTAKNITGDNVEELDKMFISINGTYGELEPPYFSKNYKNVLRLFVDDIEEDVEENGILYKCFTEEQAIELILFIERNKTKKNCIVHCAAGVSRSGAVGTFINDYLQQDYKEFKLANPWIHPNSQILAILNRVIREYDSNNFKPNWTSSPTETILDILQERKWSEDSFLEDMGWTSDFFHKMLEGEEYITKEIADKLSDILGGKNNFWLKRELQYRLDKNRLNEEKEN